MSSNLTTAMVFVMILNVLMFLAQITMLELNSESNVIYNYEGSMLSDFDAGDHQLNTENIANTIPNTEGSISPTTGNLFTDTLASIKEWFAETTGLNYLYGILAAPYSMLKLTSLPNEFVFAIGTLWYAISLLVVVAFFWGR